MPFVVDASVAACWFMPDERHPIADAAYRRIAHDSAVTPVLWWYELRNMLIVNERRGRLDGAKTARVLRLLRGLPVAVDADVEEFWRCVQFGDTPRLFGVEPPRPRIAVLERLNALAPRLPHVPFVFLTALTDRDNELRARRLGASD
jgi:hypothetical protein